MSDHHHHHHDDDCCSGSNIPNPSVVQDLDELDFERSIYQAALDDNVDRIKSLASTSPSFDVDKPDKYGYTALHYACRNGRMAAAKLLVSLGANPNTQTGSLKATCLHRAVSGNQAPMVSYLLSLGKIDIELVDIDGLSPLDRALRENRTQIIDIFKKNKN